MTKTLMATTALAMSLLAIPALAQMKAPAPTPNASVQLPGQVDVQKLIGRSVTNAQNETIGEIESVIVDNDGKARSAIVAVGGFLGMGERHVAVSWDSLTISADGQKVMSTATKDQLKALSPYIYTDQAQRRSVLVERTPTTGMAAMPAAPSAAPIMALNPISVSDLMGLNIRNAANASIGEIKDVVLAPDGKVRDVIVGVGGFLGMGERYVAIPWNQLRVTRDKDNAVIGHVDATTEQLKAMPAYKREKNLWNQSQLN